MSNNRDIAGMTFEGLVEMADQLTAQARELQAEITRRRDVQKKADAGPFIPNRGDVYFCITGSGDIGRTRFDSRANRYDRGAFDIGNVYRTKAEAEREVARRKAVAVITREIQRINAEQNWVPDWSNDRQPKFTVYYKHTGIGFSPEHTYQYQSANIFPPACREAIAHVFAKLTDELRIAMGVSK